ncbi:hypothetical protein BGX27_009205 [Mortierella sp. AM989]|nr:hypothetical protein BGX27_009205 [Mortierella sp. AM989]
MASDKKRKRSKEEAITKEASKDSNKTDATVEVIEDEDLNQPNKKVKKSKDDKKSKKDKKEKTSIEIEKKEKKEKKDRRETKEKREKKEKKEKKGKKEKKEKKHKLNSSESSPASTSDSDIDHSSSVGSSPAPSSGSDAMDVDKEVNVDMTLAAATANQEITKKFVEIMVQEKKTMDHGVTPKKSKREEKKRVSSKEIINTIVASSMSTTTRDSGDLEKNKKIGSDKNANESQNDADSPKDENGLTKKERKLLKIKQKQLNRKSEGDGEPSFNIKDGHELTLKELRDLVVFILTETPSLPWIQVLNKFKIEKVLLLYVSGLDPTLFHFNVKSSDAHKAISWAPRADTHGGPVEEFSHLREYFEKASVVKATGDKYRIFSPTNTLLNVPLSISEKTKRDKEKNDKKPKKMKAENFMMTLEELRESKFPIPRYLDTNAPELPEDWLETPKLKKTSLTPPPKSVIAMDCEMCRTEAGAELTRVTLIDHNGITILDELVQPDHKILDYLTQYSGMTAARLEGVTTRLADVQKKVKKLVDYNTILVGHSLENDMNVLKLAHPFIIDTSLIYHHTRGPPYRPGLKWLAQKWLQRHIQANVERGHDSAEDALACMDLLKLKLSKPHGFGEYEQAQESLFSRLQRFNIPRTSVLIDSDAFAGQSATKTIRTADDREVVAAIPDAIQNHNFVWARLRDIEINHGKAPEQALAEGQLVDTGRASKISSAEKIQATEEEIRAGIRSIDDSLKQIFDSLPSRTAMILTSGQGDHREVSRLQLRQKTFMELSKKISPSEIPEADRFSREDEERLEKAVELAKGGICFMTVKQYRQYKKLCTTERPEALKEYVSDEQFQKAQAYGRDKAIFSFVADTFNVVKNTLWLAYDMYPRLWTAAGSIMFKVTGLGSGYEIIQSIFFYETRSLISAVFKLPFDLYSTFVIEERHGFNKQTLKLFISDWIKQQIIQGVLEMPFYAAFFKIVSITGKNFLVYLWLFVAVFQLVMIAFYPTVIMPLFNTFTPLPEGELRTKIEALAARIKFPLTKLFVVDGSKRSGHSNAYFTGFFKNKRIVLYDTLLDHSTTDETCAVLAHELGHWDYNHMPKNIAYGLSEIYFVFYLFSKVINNKGFYQSFGFNNVSNVIVGFILFEYLYGPVGSITGVFRNIISRRYEFQADAYASNLGYADTLSTGLIKLHRKNLSNMNPDWLYCMYHKTHPELLERLDAINAPKADTKIHKTD